VTFEPGGLGGATGRGAEPMGADSGEKHEPPSDIHLRRQSEALDPDRPIREADIPLFDDLRRRARVVMVGTVRPSANATLRR